MAGVKLGVEFFRILTHLKHSSIFDVHLTSKQYSKSSLALQVVNTEMVIISSIPPFIVL